MGFLLLVCFHVLAPGPSPITGAPGGGFCSGVAGRVRVCLGLEGDLGCEVVPLVVRVTSAINTSLLRAGEVTYPFREEAAECTSVAAVSHCRAIITVVKEDYAVLGL